MRKAANQVRITAQLADAENGSELWAQAYDRPLRDIFATQDEIVEKILKTVRLDLSLSESGLPLVPAGVKHTTDNIEAYDYYLRGIAPYLTFTRDPYIIATARKFRVASRRRVSLSGV